MKKSDPLKVLESAVGDTGYWVWWAAKLPDFLQIEFIATQLYNEPKAGNAAPSGQLAMAFLKPTAVIFLSRDTGEEVPANWPDLMQSDSLETFCISEKCISFSAPELIAAIISEASSALALCGELSDFTDLKKGDCFAGFWSGPVGIVIRAEAMRLFNQKGMFDISEVQAKHDKWWEYWKKYWKLRDTPEALPFDAACEMTIPEEEKDEKPER